MGPGEKQELSELGPASVCVGTGLSWKDGRGAVDPMYGLYGNKVGEKDSFYK